MFPLGLSRAEQGLFDATLRTSHRIEVTVNLLDMGGRVVGTASVLDGQVLGDRHRFGERNGPTKRLTLTAFDPNNALGIDSGDPGDGTLYADRQVEVNYSVAVPTVGWVDVPVFLGSPTKLDRNVDEVLIHADDSSVLGMGAAWEPMTVKKGTKKVDAIERILSRRTAMTRFHTPQVKTRLAKSVSLNRTTRPWGVANRIARSMDMQLFRRADGSVVLRRLNHNIRWVFDSEIVEPVSTNDDLDGFANTVLVVGRNPKGPKKRVRVVVQAPRRHPKSAWKIGEQKPNGTVVPRRIVARIKNDHIRNKKEARRKGTRRLRDRLRSKPEVALATLPIPHLEVGDWVAAMSEEGPVEFRYDTYTLPLAPHSGTPMSVGFFLNAPTNRRRIRGKR